MHGIQRAVGANIRRFRKQRGWSQEDLAKRAARHWTYIGAIERGERNVTLQVVSSIAAALEVSVSDLLEGSSGEVGERAVAAGRHPLEEELNVTAHDILDAIQAGFRAKVDVKGKLAEHFMAKELERLKGERSIDGFDWLDRDGEPDFVVKVGERELKLECKNVRSREMYKKPKPAYKVELQKTRNSQDGTPTRGYQSDEFDVLGVCLFNHTGNWEFLYVAVMRLERRDSMPALLRVMQRVPLSPSAPWTRSLLDAIHDALKGDQQ